MSRLLRWLLVPVIILAALFLIANVVVEHVAEDRVAAAVKNEFHLSAKPTVDIQGFPIILRVLSGTVPRITFDAKRATFSGFTIESIRVRLDGLSATGGFLGSGRLAVRVRSGTIEARATQAAVNAYLHKQGESATVVLHERRAILHAVRPFLGGERTFVASGTILREGTTLVFRPSSVTVDGQPPPGGLEAAAKARATFRVKLPELPGGITLYRFSVREGALSVVASLRGQTLMLSG
jgi:hypothetical protein